MPSFVLPSEIINRLNAPWKLVGSDFPSDVSSVSKITKKRRLWSENNQHCHSSRELLLCIEGESLFCLNNKFYPCLPGTVFFINRDDSHDMEYPLIKGNMTHIWISLFDAAMVVMVCSVRNGQIEVLENSRQVIDSEKTGILFDRFDPIRSLSNLSDNQKKKGVRIIVDAVLLNLIQSNTNGIDAIETDHNIQKTVVATVSAHIKSTSGNGVSLDILARTSGYSKFHFSRIFKKYNGMTVQEFVDRCRYEKTKEMLKKNCSFKEIGDELGFSCVSSFSRWYKKYR